MTRPLRVLVSAGEASGDRLGAGLAAALRALRPDVELFGMGGDAMAAAGVRLVAHASEVTVVGIAEVASRIQNVGGDIIVQRDAAVTGDVEILIGGSEADLTLTGAPDGIFARLKPRVSSSLLGQWLKWAENANYDIQPEPESDLLYMGNQKVEEGTWYEWTTSQPITVMHNNRQWRLELKWIEEEENK